MPSTQSLPSLPLVGRSFELSMLHMLLDEAASGRGRTVVLTGESGVGKSRLARATAEEAARRGWNIAVGRAYPVETGVPYAPISDAMLPLLGKLGPDTLAVLTRGGEAELAYFFPALPSTGAQPRLSGSDSTEFKTRLLWNFSQFLGRLAAKQPLLIVLEDLHWTDTASLELLHFVARQISGDRIAIVCTNNETYADQNPTLRLTLQSLTALAAADVHRLGPLSRTETDELVRQAFGADESVTREFSGVLYGWTRGNPFFLEETLKSLVQAGRLHQREGTWLGWELDEFQLPRSIRDAVLSRADRLSHAARTVADLHAVIGTSATYDLLLSVTPLAEADFVAAIDELRQAHMLVERLEGDRVVYDFSHPLLRETLYGELGLARARLLHGTVAETMEGFFGKAADRHADELAFHFARANARHLAPKTVKYLSIAGRQALAKFAYREAADYLGAALEQVDQDSGLADGADAYAQQLVEDLARARQRLGEFEAAIRLWERARAVVEEAGDLPHLAVIELRLGLAKRWSGQNVEALARYDAGLAAAERATAEELKAKLHLAKGETLQQLGRPADSKREINEALAIAERQGNRALLARAHRALLLLHTWMGPPETAREHGARAISLAEETGDRSLGCTLHWAMAFLEGATGNGQATAHHIAACERLADELRSPLHRLWIAEIAIEYAAATGDWDAGIVQAERAIALARSFNQRTLLPRLLVWTGLIYFSRGDLQRGKTYVDEAWDLAGIGRVSEDELDVNTAVPAHTGLAGYHLAAGEYAEAIRVGEAGLAIADRSGYTVWAIHRLIPIITESCLWLGDLERAERIGKRLRRDADRIGHKLGLAWADTCDALVVWLRGQPEQAVSLFRQAVEALESIPAIPDSARLRRLLAACLAQSGDRDGALRELRDVHEVFSRIGAEIELNKTRDQFRDLGARPPAREAGVGAAGLTPREVEIVRLILQRRSNKAIGQALDISARTVSTHLSHIFRKLNVSSRGELAEVARKLELPTS